jgi:hypothetical protein
LFDYIDVVTQKNDGGTIKYRCDIDVVQIKNIDKIYVDIEHKSKYTGIFPRTGRLMVDWNGSYLTISQRRLEDDDNAETV